MLGSSSGGGGGSSKRRHSTQSLSLLYRPSKPDIDLIRDQTRRGSTSVTTCGVISSSGGVASSSAAGPGSFLGNTLRRHSEVVSPISTSTSPTSGGGRQVRLSIDSGRVVQEFHFVKRSFFKSADQIYNKVFGTTSTTPTTSSATAEAYAAHYGGAPGSNRGRSKSFNALQGVTLNVGAGASPGVGGGGVSDFSSLGQAIESHLRNQLRRATFSNINEENNAGGRATLLQPLNNRPRSHSTCGATFPTIIVTGSGGIDHHHGVTPTASLVRTEYENKTQVILEEPSATSNNSAAATGVTLCGLVREILARTFSVGVGFIRGHQSGQAGAGQRSGGGSSNKRFFF